MQFKIWTCSSQDIIWVIPICSHWLILLENYKMMHYGILWNMPYLVDGVSCMIFSWIAVWTVHTSAASYLMTKHGFLNSVTIRDILPFSFVTLPLLVTNGKQVYDFFFKQGRLLMLLTCRCICWTACIGGIPTARTRMRESSFIIMTPGWLSSYLRPVLAF